MAIARGLFATACCRECARDYALDLDDLAWHGLGETRLADLPLRCPRCGSRDFEVLLHDSIEHLLHEWLAEAICDGAREAKQVHPAPAAAPPGPLPRPEPISPGDRLGARRHFLRHWSLALRDRLRREVTIAVDARHAGGISRGFDPREGTIFECSWDQAQQIHTRYPLVLDRVLSPDVAHFHPARISGLRLPDSLPKPPYAMARATLRPPRM